MKDAKAYPIFYKEYIDAVVSWQQLCLTEDYDGQELERLVKVVRVKEDILLALGLKPHEDVVRSIREYLVAHQEYSKVCTGEEFDEGIEQALSYLNQCVARLRELCVGVFVKYTVTDSGTTESLSFFTYTNK